MSSFGVLAFFVILLGSGRGDATGNATTIEIVVTFPYLPHRSPITWVSSHISMPPMPNDNASTKVNGNLHPLLEGRGLECAGIEEGT